MKVARSDKVKINKSIVDMARRSNWGFKYVHVARVQHLGKERAELEKRGYVFKENIDADEVDDVDLEYESRKENNEALQVRASPAHMMSSV